MVIGEWDGACFSRRLEEFVRGSRRLSTEADPEVARPDGFVGVWKLRIRMRQAFRLGENALRVFRLKTFLGEVLTFGLIRVAGMVPAALVVTAVVVSDLAGTGAGALLVNLEGT